MANIQLAHGNISLTTLPSVSVIIPCHNAEKWIERAIQSVLDQTGTNVKVIVIDDGSIDGSAKVIASFGDRVTWETGPNRGACVARNRGMSIANAEWVMFLDSDDWLEPGSLSTWAFCGAQAGADVVFGSWSFLQDGKLSPAQSIDNTLTALQIVGQWLDGRYVPPCSVLWRRSFIVSVGGWNETVLRNQDGELVMRAIFSGAKVSVSEKGTGVYVQHDAPGRISMRRGNGVLANELAVFKSLSEMPGAHRTSEIRLCFARAFYRVANKCFEARADDLGQRALMLARECGLKGHSGSFLHRVFCRMLGLKRKARLSRFLMRMTSTIKSGLLHSRKIDAKCAQ